MLLVGTSVSKIKDEQESALYFLNSTSLEVVKKMPIGRCSVTDVKWSEAINQIIVGTTSNEARIYFDQRLSRKGAV